MALEASAAGVPVVATAVGGTPEVIAEGETGFLVPPGEPASIAAKVNELCAHRAYFANASARLVNAECESCSCLMLRRSATSS